MIILSKRDNVHQIEGRMIVPGINVIADEDADVIRNSQALQEQVDGKYMSVKTDKDIEEGSKGGLLSETLANLNAKKAVALVKETLDIKAIREALDVEDRASVIKALEAQEKELAPDPKTDKDESKDEKKD